MKMDKSILSPMKIRKIFTQKSDFFGYTSDFDRENIRLNKTAEASLPDTKKFER